MGRSLEERLCIKKQSTRRAQAMKFAEPITNICASKDGAHWLFVKYNKGSHTVWCTDGHGKFHETAADVIHPGHLNPDECSKLFKPVWEATYGQNEG